MGDGERIMLDHLHRRYSALSMGSRRYAVAEHVADRTGWATRRADFIAQDAHSTHTRRDGSPATYRYPGGYDGETRYLLHGHEVKVSRSDWLRELADPSKAEAWSRYCDRWWLVVPDKAIVKPGELPDSWGLLVLAGTGLRAAVRAPLLDPEPMPVPARAALMRAVAATALRGAPCHLEHTGPCRPN